VVVKEVEIITVVDAAEINTLKYVVIFFILVVVLALGIVLLCFFRSHLKKQTKSEMDKIRAEMVKTQDQTV